MKHRIIAALLVLAALLSFLPTVHAAQGELTYTVQDGQVTVTGTVEAPVGQLVIPETIDGYPVTAIANGAFIGANELISVVIQAKVDRLERVFTDCLSLSEVILPEGLVRLEGTFRGCSQLAELTLPSTVRYLGSDTFADTALTQLVLPSGLREIGDRCFRSTPLTAITLPNGLERIGSEAFGSRFEQDYLEIPASVRFIGAKAFEGALGTVVVRGTDTSCGAQPFSSVQLLYCHRTAPLAAAVPTAVYFEELSYAPTAYPICREGDFWYTVVAGEAIIVRALCDGDVTVPAELGGAAVTALGPFCFYREKTPYLQLTLPDTIRSVGRSAVCARSSNVPQQLQYAGDYAFADVPLRGTPQFSSLISAGTESFRGCGLTEVVFGSALRSLGRRAFSRNRLRSVTLAEGVETLGAEVFAWNSSLSELTVPSTVTQCEDCLKYSGVSRVLGYPDSPMEAYCERAEIPFVNLLTGEESSGTRLVTIDHIQYKIFSSGKAWVVGSEPQYLTGEVVIPPTVEGATVERICDSALANCAAVTVRLPYTLRVLEDWAFLRCSELTYVEIPQGLETMLGTPFAACEKLRLLYLPAGFRRNSTSAAHLYGLELLVGYAGTDAEQFAADEGLRFIALPENAVPIMNETGVFLREDEALTALYLRPMQSGGATTVIVPDDVAGIPVTRLAAGSVGNPNSAALGANVLYVDEGAFYADDEEGNLTQLMVPSSVRSLPSTLCAAPNLTIIGTVETYAEQYAEEKGYRFLDPETTPFRDVSRTAWYHDAVRSVYWNGLMNGVSEHSFAPEDTTTRAMIAKVLANLSGIRDFPWSYGFRDVPDNAWYAPAVNWGAMVGIIQGTSKTAFSPNDPVTREQLAALLYRFAQACNMKTDARADLSAYTDRGQISQYALSAMQWAVASGILRGTDAHTLNPLGYATRAEIAQMVSNFMRYIGRNRNAADRLLTEQ